ncbi:MAG: hypothetical protein ACRC7O_03440 [Fimbriiglobus sp.]
MIFCGLIELEDGSRDEFPATMPRYSPAKVMDIFYGSLTRGGYRVEKVNDTTFRILGGTDNGKFSPVKRVKFTCPDLPVDQQPKITDRRKRT